MTTCGSLHAVPRLPRRAVRWLVPVLAIAMGVVLCWRSVFVVDPTQVAWVLSLGRPVRGPIMTAGWYGKWPWQETWRFDRRLHVLECDAAARWTGDLEPVVVQPYACWRVAPDGWKTFLAGVGDVDTAQRRLTVLIWKALDAELSTHRFTDWVNAIADRQPATQPAQVAIMSRVTRSCRQEAGERFGIELLDVGLRRFNRPERMKESVYRQMIADWDRRVNQVRQETRVQVAELEATARRDAEAILAQARAQAAAVPR